jgi:putative ABC transport system substrate-binding protein
VAKILNGARPADLPVRQPTYFNLILNQQTAGFIGLTFPVSVQQQATEIIP